MRKNYKFTFKFKELVKLCILYSFTTFCLYNVRNICNLILTNFSVLDCMLCGVIIVIIVFAVVSANFVAD